MILFRWKVYRKLVFFLVQRMLENDSIDISHRQVRLLPVLDIQSQTESSNVIKNKYNFAVQNRETKTLPSQSSSVGENPCLLQSFWRHKNLPAQKICSTTKQIISKILIYFRENEKYGILPFSEYDKHIIIHL